MSGKHNTEQKRRESIFLNERFMMATWVAVALSGLASPAHMKQGLYPCLWSYSPFRTFP